MNELRPSHLLTQSIGLIEFDALINEQHESTLTLSENPVENGSPIIDHFYPDPQKLTLTVGQNLDGFVIGELPEDDQADGTRLADFYFILKQAQLSGELFEVGTGIELYQNMIIRGLSTIRDKTQVTILQVVISMQEVRRVSATPTDRFAEQYSEQVGVRERASEVVPRGQVSETDITNTIEQEQLDRSLLKSGILRFFPG